MELGEIQRFITNATEQMKSDQLLLFISWFEEKFSKNRIANTRKLFKNCFSRFILQSKIAFLLTNCTSMI